MPSFIPDRNGFPKVKKTCSPRISFTPVPTANADPSLPKILFSTSYYFQGLAFRYESSPLCSWLISPVLMSFRPILVVSNTEFHLFLRSVLFHCVHMLHFLCLFITCLILRLIPQFEINQPHCEECGSEYLFSTD